MSTQEHEAAAEKALGHAHASGTCLLARDVAAALADAVRVARVECDMDWCHFLALEEDAKRGPDLLSCTLSIPCTNPLHNIGEGDATPGPSPEQQAYDEQLDGHIRNGSWEPATPGPEPDRDFENLKWGKSEHQAFPATPPKKGRE